MDAPTPGRLGWLLCDVSALTDPDLGDLGELARLQLRARRSGRELRLVGAGERLRELIALVGLSEQLPLLTGPVLLQPRRQPEQREEHIRVEEAVQPDDPPG